MNRSSIAIALLAGTLVAGCSPQSYRRWADADVNRILSDRKVTTLGYSPDTTTKLPSEPVNAPEHAFDKIPATPIPPTTQPAIEPEVVTVPYGVLGPDAPDEDAGYSGLSDSLDVAVALRRSSSLVLGPPAPGDMVLNFDLFRALDYAVQHSREYETQIENLYLAALDVTLERHLFAPRPFVRTGLRYDGGQDDVNFRSALSATASAGIRQQLPYGGEIVAETLVEFVDALNRSSQNAEAASVALTGSIPLLRGAGMVNLEPLIQSERDLIYEVREFEEFRRDFLVDVASAYFRLLTQRQALQNRRLNYANLAALTEQTQALYEAGRISFLQVQLALQAQLVAENAILSAEERYEAALDNFKVLIGMPVEQDLEITPVSLEVAVPTIEMQDAVALAMKYRLDLQTARDRIEDAMRGVEVAENQLLPDLDLTATGRVGNRADTPAAAIDGRTTTYGAGITLDLPVDRLAERNAYRRSLIEYQRAQREYEELKDLVSVDARGALRQIRLAQASLEIQRRGIELAQRRLDNANELLLQGKASSNSREVVDAQESLLDAQDSYEQAQATLQISVLEYLRDTGTLRIDPQAGTLSVTMDRTRRLNDPSRE